MSLSNTPVLYEWRVVPSCSQRSSDLFRCPSSLLFLLAYFTTPSSIGVAAFLFLAPRNKWRNGVMASMLIHGHEGQVSRRDMTRGSGYVILDPAFHADLHRGPERAVHR